MNLEKNDIISILFLFFIIHPCKGEYYSSYSIALCTSGKLSQVSRRINNKVLDAHSAPRLGHWRLSIAEHFNMSL